MSGPLNSIFAAVNPIITANLAPSSLVPSYVMTGGERAEEAATPRISWVPIAEDFLPPSGQGGDAVITPTGMSLPGNAQPPLYTRQVSVECDLWGDDRDQVETMINAVVSAVHDAMHGVYGIASASWLLPEATERDGETYRIVFQFAVPVIRVRPNETVAQVTGFPVTPSSSLNQGS